MVVKTKRRAVLDAARQKVKDAMEELDQVSAEDPEEGEADEGATTHIHIHQGGASKGSTTSEDDGEEGDPGQEEDPTEARFKAIETGMAALADSVKGLTEAMRPAAAATDEEDDGDGGDDDTDTQDGDEPFDEKNGMAKDGEAEPSEDDKKKGTTDSAALATSYALTLASAEILVPGFRMPTFDGKAKRKKTIDAMCGARRKCLDIVYATKDGQTLVDSVAGKSGIDLAKMSCGSIATLFKAASGVKALLNNRSATGDSGGMAKVDEPKPAVTIADINKANQSYWAGRVAKA